MKTENLQIQIVRWSYDKHECSVRMKYTMKCSNEAEKKDGGLMQSVD